MYGTQGIYTVASGHSFFYCQDPVNDEKTAYNL